LDYDGNVTQSIAAVQRGAGAKNRLAPSRSKEIYSQFIRGLTKPHGMRFSPPSDVIAF
jgi:hypothetical protein